CSPFSLIHLAPTLLEILAHRAPPEFTGTSYWDRIRRNQSWTGLTISECASGCTNPFRRAKRMAARLLALRGTRYKLVFDGASGEDQLFDLERDPGEKSPVPRSELKAERRLLLEAARDHIAGFSHSHDTVLEWNARLRDLGLEWAQAGSRVSSPAACSP